MAKRKYRVVFRKTSPLMKTLILVTVLLCTVALVTLHAINEQNRNQYEAMWQQAAALEEDNQSIMQQIDDMGSLESVIRIAMERLGLVLPDTTLFDTDKD